jgi:hypothetical protein
MKTETQQMIDHRLLGFFAYEIKGNLLEYSSAIVLFHHSQILVNGVSYFLFHTVYLI